MSNPYTPALLQELIKYDRRTGELRWRERSVEVYQRHAPHVTEEEARRRTDHFNRVWARGTVGTDSNGSVRRVRISLGQRTPAKRYNVMAVVWAIVTGEWPVDGMLARDGDVDNLVPNNIIQCTRAVACIFANPLSGITTYETVNGTRYKWTISTTDQEVLATGVQCETQEIARQQRDKSLTELGKWKVVSLGQYLEAQSEEA